MGQSFIGEEDENLWYASTKQACERWNYQSMYFKMLKLKINAVKQDLLASFQHRKEKIGDVIDILKYAEKY